MKTQNIIAAFVVAVALAGNVNAGNYLNQSCVEYLSVERPDETKADIQDICNIISQTDEGQTGNPGNAR